jgi:hypothetical protein
VRRPPPHSERYLGSVDALQAITLLVVGGGGVTAAVSVWLQHGSARRDVQRLTELIDLYNKLPTGTRELPVGVELQRAIVSDLVELLWHRHVPRWVLRLLGPAITASWSALGSGSLLLGILVFGRAVGLPDGTREGLWLACFALLAGGLALNLALGRLMKGQWRLEQSGMVERLRDRQR